LRVLPTAQKVQITLTKLKTLILIVAKKSGW